MHVRHGQAQHATPASPRPTFPSDPQEPGFSDGLAVGRESDVDGLTDPERHTEDEENADAGRRKSRTRRRKEKHRGRSGEEQLAGGQVRTGQVSTPRQDCGQCVFVCACV